MSFCTTSLFFSRLFTLSTLTALTTTVAFTATFHNSTEVRCTIERIYHSSALEKKWIEIIDHVSDRTPAWEKGCKKVKEDEDKIRKLLQHYSEWRKQARNGSPLNESWPDEGIMSYFETKEICSDSTTQTMKTPIEPLIGFLRHPAYHCLKSVPDFANVDIVDKNYMFMMNREQIVPRAKRNNVVTRNYMFDLGASLYTTGAGGASQQWFVDTYHERGIDFDRIFAWEATKHEPTKIFADYPGDVAGKISYYNVPCPTDVNDTMSPIRMIKALVRPDDFLVFKIDIDNDPVEIAIINSFIDDRNVTDLIDEFFFEHHVSNNPVEHRGWGLGQKINNITESYALFEKLRKIGIRAHSWV